MLNVELAEKIIDKLSGCTDYNINIMNEKGIIVASKDKSRIGTFHEVAFEIIEKNLDYKTVETEDTYLGTKPGINLAMEYKKKIIGVLGLTGEADNGKLHAVAAVIKKMLETVLEYEDQKEASIKRKTDKTRFVNSLLYEDMSRAELESMAQVLGYADVPRIPILITFGQNVKKQEIIDIIRAGEGGIRSNNLVFDNLGGKILVFKSYERSVDGFFDNYKYFIGEYLGRFLRYVAENQIKCKICVGSLQSGMVNYKFGYQHCLWLEKMIASEKRSVFFYDYLDEYLKYQLPFLELHKVFDVFAKQYTDEFKKLYTENIGALYDNNYSMQESSKHLYIHKNTLTFRLDKIKNQLGLNPVQNARDRELVNYFYYYLKQLS